MLPGGSDNLASMSPEDAGILRRREVELQQQLQPLARLTELEGILDVVAEVLEQPARFFASRSTNHLPEPDGCIA
jgi:hypothetical protein